MKYIKLFENFNSVKFIRFSKSEIPEGELTPTLRRKYQNVNKENIDVNKENIDVNEEIIGVYEWTEKLKAAGFPDNKVAVHFMTDDTATAKSETFRTKLYGNYKYEIQLKDPNQNLGWSFGWPINEWFYKTNMYISNPDLFLKSPEGKKAIKSLEPKIGYLKDVYYDKLEPEDSKKIVNALLEAGLIGFGTIDNLMSSELYNKENLFVWTSHPVIVKSI